MKVNLFFDFYVYVKLLFHVLNCLRYCLFSHKIYLAHVCGFSMSFHVCVAPCLAMYLCFRSSSLCFVKSLYPVTPNETVFFPSMTASYFLSGLDDFLSKTSGIFLYYILRICLLCNRQSTGQGYGLLGIFRLGSYPTPHVRILVIEWIRLSIV